MRDFALVLASIGLTMLCWGSYGPLMRSGQVGMGHLRPFICVGVAYFLIAVLAPAILMGMKQEAGRWTMTGAIWSLAAGALGALGALGIILAFVYGGSPVYVMPLVFGGAPVVNTFVTMYLSKSYKQAGPLFYAGLILVIVGAVCVLICRPGTGKTGVEELTFSSMLWIAAAIGLTVVSWGAYGPILHKGQVAMQGSRLRPLMCVGLAYFLIAVLIPLVLLPVVADHGSWEFMGSVWSLLGGSAGAVGALGIILAFNFGGKPVYVMPLVFGGAPVINTFISITQAGAWGATSPFFYAGLIVVIAGAATVLVFAPKGGPHVPKPAASTAATPH